MKSESLFRTVDAVRRLGRDLPLKFVIVGDGNVGAELKRLADDTNAELGHRAVVLTGALLDPRPAYAAADIVIGMGGSALRGMAFGKAVPIVGEQGTADVFYHKGIYGRGDGNLDSGRLAADIRRLAEDINYLPKLGEFSRQFVERNFSLETVSHQLAEYCRDAASHLLPASGRVEDRSPGARRWRHFAQGWALFSRKAMPAFATTTLVMIRMSHPCRESTST